MRHVIALSIAMLSAGCGEEDRSWAEEFEAQRYVPLEGEVAINGEYSIVATFPKGHPVCRSYSGEHEHGFYQRLDSDRCTDRDESKRFLSVWADYNAMEWSWARAREELCGADAVPLDLGVLAEADGELLACKPKAPGNAYEVTVSYLVDDPAEDLFKPEDGPELVYTVWLGTTAQTDAADLQILREFLARLRLADGGFRIERKL